MLGIATDAERIPCSMLRKENEGCSQSGTPAQAQAPSGVLIATNQFDNDDLWDKNTNCTVQMSSKRSIVSDGFHSLVSGDV